MLFSKHLNGIHVNHYKNTAGLAIMPMSLPEKVCIPMSQNIGAPCEPLVAVGDYVKVGQLIADSKGFVSAPIHSSVSGEVVKIEKMISLQGKFDTHIVIQTDGKQTVAETVVPPVVDSKESFLAAVRASGVVGLGGATFPMSVKLAFKDDMHVDTLIVNGAECESYITTDHMTMIAHTREIINGIKNIMHWVGIEKAVIGIEDNKKDAIEAFEKLLEGETGISVFVLRSVYPQGAERVICYETTGRHLVAGKLPADVGVVVSNVNSIFRLEQYLETGMPLVSQSITVDGNAIANPMNIEVPIGTQVSDIIEYCGGETKPIRKIILGGPMMGRAIPKDEYGVSKGVSAILCFDDTVAQTNKETACINCGRCVESCPMNLMPARLSKAYKDKDIDALRKYNVLSCMDCGSCSYMCPARKPLNFEIRMAKGLVMADDKAKAAKAAAKAEGGNK